MTEEQKNQQTPTQEAEHKQAQEKSEQAEPEQKQSQESEVKEKQEHNQAQEGQEEPAEKKQEEPEAIEKALEQAKTTGKLEQIELPNIKPGMLIRVHQKIKETSTKAKDKGKEKERIQIFEGIVLAVRGSGNQKTFTVRKKSQGIGVEKIFPLSAPCVEKVEVMKEYRTRRAKLGFLRGHYKKKLKKKEKAK